MSINVYLNCEFCLLQRFRNQFADENNTTKVSALHNTAINVTSMLLSLPVMSGGKSYRGSIMFNLAV